jgi:hypothetical protein
MNGKTMQEICDTQEVAPFINETVTSVLKRQFARFCGNKVTSDCNDEPSVYRSFDLRWLKGEWELWPVGYAILSALTEHSQNQRGGAQRFTPLIAPFHVDAKGEPTTQIRVYAYTPKLAEGEKGIPTSTIIARLEPFGFQTKFDAQSKYAQVKAATDEIVVPAEYAEQTTEEVTA